MAIATRNLYLVLKARDEASRVIRGFGRELTRASRIAQAENLRNLAGLAAQRASALQLAGASQAEIDAQHHLARSLRLQAAELERSHRAAMRFANTLHTVSAAAITVGSGLAIGGAAGLAFLYSAVNVAKEYERQVRLTATQVDNFKASLQDIAEVGLRVAKTIAVPFEEIQPALYNILSSTNANLEQAEILLKGFAKTAVAGQVSIEDAARGTIPILNAFNIPLEKVNDILDIQFQLVRKGVGTYDEFASVFGRVVPSATRAGQSFETVAAMLAYLTRNGLSAAMASTSAARALDAMSHPTAVKHMEQLGIKVRDLKGNFLPLEQVLKNLRDHLNKLPQAKRVQELVEIFKGAGGTIQARRFLEQVLLRPGELEEFIGFLGDMRGASGAFDTAYNEMANSVAAQTELMRNKWKVLQETVGRIVTPIFIVVIGWIQKLLDAFNNLSPGTQRFLVIGLAVVSVLTVIAGAVVIALGALAGLIAAITAAGVSFFAVVGGIGAVVAAVLAVGAAFKIAWDRSENFRKVIMQTRDVLLRFWKEAIVPFAMGVKQAFDQHLREPLQKLWEVIETKVFPAFMTLRSAFMDRFIPAAREVMMWVKTLLAKAFEFIGGVINTMVIPAIKYLTTYYYEHKQTIDQVVSVVIWLGKQALKLAAILGGVLAFVIIGPVIAAIVAAIAALFAIGAAVIWVIERVKAIINWFKGVASTTASLKITVLNEFNAMVAFLSSIPGRIQAALGDLSGLLVNAGRSVINGLIQGIRGMFGSLRAIVSEGAAIIRDAFPGSPAKWGPLAGAGSMYYAGQELVRQLQEGMSSQSAQLGGVTGMVAGTTASVLQAPGVVAGSTFNQTINVYTQEINPRRHAAELGFALAGRM